MIEKKVTAATLAAGASGMIIFILGHYVFKGHVPDVVASWVYVAVPAVLTFAAGYLAKHTPRPNAPGVVAAPAPASATALPPEGVS